LRWLAIEWINHVLCSEVDYIGMVKGFLELEVRAALTYYARKRLGLDRPADAVKPQDQQIILTNDEEVCAALIRLETVPR
jgi:hypothetical protein